MLVVLGRGTAASWGVCRFWDARRFEGCSATLYQLQNLCDRWRNADFYSFIFYFFFFFFLLLLLSVPGFRHKRHYIFVRFHQAYRIWFCLSADFYSCEHRWHQSLPHQDISLTGIGACVSRWNTITSSFHMYVILIWMLSYHHRLGLPNSFLP